MNSAYQAQSRKLTGPLRRLAWRSGRALELWASGEENPFFLRDSRLDARRDKPRRTLLAVAALILLCNLVSWGLLYAFGQAWQRNAILAVRSAQTPDDLIGWTTLQFLIAHPLFLAAIIACAVSGYATIWVCQSRAAALLKAELLKGTLEQLQLLPLAEERWLWLMSAQPAATGLLIGGLGLPLYLLAVLTGQWSVWDVLGLFLVFAWLANIVPSWNPSRQTAAKTRAQGAASGQRKVERGPQAGGAAVDERLPDASASQLGSFSDPAFFFDPALWLIGLLLRQGLVEVFRLRQTAAPSGSGEVFWSHVFGWLPSGIRVLLPALPLAWPLLLARCLMTPFPFFRWVLPPIVLWLPFWLGVRLKRYSYLATRVSTANLFWQQRCVRRRKATGRLHWWCVGLMAVGYGWRPLVLHGGLGAILEAPLTLAWALAAAWTLALVLGTAVAARWLIKAWTPVEGSAVSLPTSWRLTRRGVARGLGGAVGLYFMACWLGGCAGVSEPWLSRLVPTLVTVFACLMALGGSLALQVVLPVELRQPWRWLRNLWFYGLPIEAFARIIHAWARSSNEGIIQNFAFEQAPHLVLSPTVSLLALFRSDLNRPSVPWYLGPLFQIAVGSICLLAHLRTVRSQATFSDSPSGAGWWTHFKMALYALWRRGLLACCAFAAWMWSHLCPWLRRLWEALEAHGEAWAQYLLRWAEHLDNPLITLQFRKQARQWVGLWLSFVGAGAFFMLLMGHPWKLIFMPRQASVLAPGFLHLPYDTWQTWGMILVLTTLGVAGVIVTLVVIGLGQAFDAERHAGTLVFLFLTALTDEELLIGKLLPRLVFGAGVIGATLPFLGLGCLVAGCGGDWSWCLISVGGLLAIASTLIFVANWQLLFAARATKPVEGILLGLAGAAPIEAAGWALIVSQTNSGTINFITALLVVTLLHGALAVMSWNLARTALRRQRYGDVALTGTKEG